MCEDIMFSRKSGVLIKISIFFTVKNTLVLLFDNVFNIPFDIEDSDKFLVTFLRKSSPGILLAFI